MLSGVPVEIPCSRANGFRLSPAELEAAITPRTRWLILNSPSNPSGAVYSAADFRALSEVLACHRDVAVLSDEIYEHIVFADDGFTSFGQACPDLRDRTLIVNGVSKAYAMTGWRVGYGVGPEDLIKAMTTVQSQATSSVCSIAQAAAVAALTGPQDNVAKFRAAFRSRRDLVTEGLNRVPGLSLAAPEGAFYAYVDCSGWIAKSASGGQSLKTDVDVAEFLLRSAKIAVVPGAAYGLSPYFRISTATSEPDLNRAIERIGQAASLLN